MAESEPTPKGFPRQLLEQSVSERLSYFDKVVVSHERLKEVRDRLLHAIRYSSGTSLILVFGPTGVGKTTLRQQIEMQLIKDAASDPHTNPGYIPVVAVEAVSPDSGNFNWRDYYIRALMAIDEPMLEHKITYELRGIHRDDAGKLFIERSVTAPNLRRVLEKCLQHRQPRAFIVDEAQHFQKMASGDRLLDQMDSLKSLASLTKTVHVLIGTYDLLELTKLSAQLSRRTIKIHFPRYRAENADDFKEFKKLLRTLQWHLPLAEMPDLESRADYFYDRCLGCIGMLKTWLYRTLAGAIEQDKTTITEKLWKEQEEAPGTLIDMYDEISRGENEFREREDQGRFDDLRISLRIKREESNKKPGKGTQDMPRTQNPAPLPQSDPALREESTSTPSLQSDSPSKEEPPPPLVKSSSTSKRKKKYVGEPNPVRRPVGQEEPRAS